MLREHSECGRRDSLAPGPVNGSHEVLEGEGRKLGARNGVEGCKREKATEVAATRYWFAKPAATVRVGCEGE